jgi:hypothetical protein
MSLETLSFVPCIGCRGAAVVRCTDCGQAVCSSAGCSLAHYYTPAPNHRCPLCGKLACWLDSHANGCDPKEPLHCGCYSPPKYPWRSAEDLAEDAEKHRVGMGNYRARVAEAELSYDACFPLARGEFVTCAGTGEPPRVAGIGLRGWRPGKRGRLMVLFHDAMRRGEEPASIVWRLQPPA